MKSPRIMFGYAVFLLICGLIGWTMAGFTSAARTAIIIPAACALLMVICGLMAKKLPTNRTVGMIGIHAGLILPLLYTVAFIVQGWRNLKAWQADEAELYRPVLFALLIAGSLLTFWMLLNTRPRAEERG